MNPFDGDKPIIIQSDRSILLVTGGPRYEGARDFLAQFAELEKSPEKIHTYRLTPLSLWNAAASGLNVDDVLHRLADFSAFDVPENVASDIEEYMSRYGRLQLKPDPDSEDLLLEADEPVLMTEVRSTRALKDLLGEPVSETVVRVPRGARGEVKQALVAVGRPVEDLAGYTAGAPLDVELATSESFDLRDYQREAVAAFHAAGGETGGSGVVVLPCGAGKTIVGIAAMATVGSHTLVLTANNTAVKQWRREILEKTTLTEDQVGEYTGHEKTIRPVTIATYQILTHRSRKDEEFVHMPLFDEHDWGLIVYDEVHLLPAPVFRATSEIQSRRRLGLTATLVREDEREEEVFALIGPKKYDAPWRELERRGWIAPARCVEMRVPFGDDDIRYDYAAAERREKFRIASTNPLKLEVARALADAHEADHVLIIGQYLDQLEMVADVLDAPLITGRTPQKKRDELYQQFKSGEIKRLVVSKVANFAVDLPDATVAIQVSGTFGSRQEEAQRLGRVLRPKKDGRPATFYTLVTLDTVELDFAAKRQLFLTEQGYRYEIESVQEGQPQARRLIG